MPRIPFGTYGWKRIQYRINEAEEKRIAWATGPQRRASDAPTGRATDGEPLRGGASKLLTSRTLPGGLL
jgi:hypothetical protein